MTDRRHRPPASGGPGIELIVFSIVALIGGGSAVVWLAGNLASLLAGSGSLPLGLLDGAAVLKRLPGTLSDPAQAWPAAVREQLPGATTITIALALAVLVVGALLIVALWLALRLQHPRQPRRARSGPPGATCATCASHGHSAAGWCSAATTSGCWRPSRGRR